MTSVKYTNNSILGLINQITSGKEWKEFKTGKMFADPLVFLHETSHWFQSFGLIYRMSNSLAAIHYDEITENLRLPLLDKIIALKKLLRPINEGLALYVQYDYFPANFFSNFGPRNFFDSLVELIATERFSFKKYEYLQEKDLAKRTEKFLIKNRYDAVCTRKKKELLLTPFFSGEEHITGYLLIKDIVSRIRSENPFYTHDGSILETLVDFFYNDPVLIGFLLDEKLGPVPFIKAVGNRLEEKMAKLRDANFLRTVYEKIFVAGTYSLNLFEFSEQEIAQCFNKDEELLSKALKKKTGKKNLTAWQISGVDSPIKFFEKPITIHPLGNSFRLVMEDSGLELVLTKKDLEAKRAKTYKWISYPEKTVKGRIIEYLFSLNDEFFHISLIDYEGGIVALNHKTNDYNLGYHALSLYLPNAYEIDLAKKEFLIKISSYESGFIYKDEIKAAIENCYVSPLKDITRDLFNNGINAFSNATEIFPSEWELNSFISFSIILKLFDHDSRYINSITGQIEQFKKFNGLELDISFLIDIIEKKHPAIRQLKTNDLYPAHYQAIDPDEEGEWVYIGTRL